MPDSPLQAFNTAVRKYRSANPTVPYRSAQKIVSQLRLEHKKWECVNPYTSTDDARLRKAACKRTSNGTHESRHECVEACRDAPIRLGAPRGAASSSSNAPAPPRGGTSASMAATSLPSKVERFRFDGDLYTVLGTNPRARKYKIHARRDDGLHFDFESADVKPDASLPPPPRTDFLEEGDIITAYFLTEVSGSGHYQNPFFFQITGRASNTWLVRPLEREKRNSPNGTYREGPPLASIRETFWAPTNQFKGAQQEGFPVKNQAFRYTKGSGHSVPARLTMLPSLQNRSLQLFRIFGRYHVPNTVESSFFDRNNGGTLLPSWKDKGSGLKVH